MTQLLEPVPLWLYKEREESKHKAPVCGIINNLPHKLSHKTQVLSFYSVKWWRFSLCFTILISHARFECSPNFYIKLLCGSLLVMMFKSLSI